jgi:phenylalanyl-tRNA synthetase alpha chain
MTTPVESSNEETAILTFLSSSEDATIPDTFQWCADEQNAPPLDHLKVVGAVKSLSAEAYVTTTDLATSFYELTDEGTSVLTNGSPEMLVLKTLCQANEQQSLSLPDLERVVGKDVAKIGMGNCMRSKWIQKQTSQEDGKTILLKACKTLDDVQDEAQLHLQELQAAGFGVDAVDGVVSVLFLCFCF